MTRSKDSRIFHRNARTNNGRRPRRSAGTRAAALARIVAFLRCAQTAGAFQGVPLLTEALVRPLDSSSGSSTVASSHRECPRAAVPTSLSLPRRSPCWASCFSSSSTALLAFWSRASDADGSTVSSDPARRGANSLWRKLSRRDGTDDISSDDRRRAAASAARPMGRVAKEGGRGEGKDGAGKMGRAGSRRGSALSVTTRPTSSSERYIYSASYLSELCPSFDIRAARMMGPEDSWKCMEECILDESFYERLSKMEEAGMKGKRKEESSSSKTTWAGRIIESALTDLVNRHALHTLNLQIAAASSSRSTSSARRAALGSQIVPLLVRGYVPPVSAAFDRLSFPSLALSGGGTLSARSVTLNSLSFLPLMGRFLRRFRDPFELRAEDCVFTQEDVQNSRLVRNGLGRLLDNVLKRVVAGAHEVLEVAVTGVEDFVGVDVTSVDIMDNSNMISCTGIITTKADHPDVPFSVRTGLSSSHLGRVLHFPGMEMVLNPSSPIPVVLPLHVWHPVDLDIGANARINEVEIDGRRGTLRLTMNAVMTPGRSGGRAVDETADPRLWARYSCDVAKLLTNACGFSS